MFNFVACLPCQRQVGGTKNQKAMAHVHYLDPVDYLNGKIAKRYRTIYCRRKDTDNRYTSVYNTPTVAQSAAQLASIARFRQAAQQTNTIMADIAQVETYRTQWRAHMQSGNPRYRTLRGFIFAQVYQTL